jgi:hypothetical protein
MSCPNQIVTYLKSYKLLDGYSMLHVLVDPWQSERWHAGFQANWSKDQNLIIYLGIIVNNVVIYNFEIHLFKWCTCRSRSLAPPRSFQEHKKCNLIRKTQSTIYHSDNYLIKKRNYPCNRCWFPLQSNCLAMTWRQLDHQRHPKIKFKLLFKKVIYWEE